MYRAGLAEAERERQELELVAELSDGLEAVEQMRELRPDAALVDMRLPSLDGVEVLMALRDEDVPTRVLMLSAYSDGAFVYEALEAGAAGYMSKDASGEEICEGLLAVLDGRTVLSPGLEQALAQEVSSHEAVPHAGLSTRENQILSMTAEGLSRAAIGTRLNLSEGTVKTYLQRAYEKLGVSGRAAAIAEAMRRGILV